MSEIDQKGGGVQQFSKISEIQNVPNVGGRGEGGQP